MRSRPRSAAPAHPGPPSSGTLDLAGAGRDGDGRLGGARARRRRARRAARRPQQSTCALHARWQDVLARDPEYADAEREHRAALREHRAAVPASSSTPRCAGCARWPGTTATTPVRSAARDRRARPSSGSSTTSTWPVCGRPVRPSRTRGGRASAMWSPSTDPPCRTWRAARRRWWWPAGTSEVLLPRAAAVRGARAPRRSSPGPQGRWRSPSACCCSTTAPRTARRDAEFFDSGLGWLRGCVLLPHARRRLRTDDPVRMAELAARCGPGALRGPRRRHPARPRSATGSCPPDARVVADDGHIAGRRHDRRLRDRNRLRDQPAEGPEPLDRLAVDRFLARHEVPIVEGARCTFLWRGEADEVQLVQRIVGLPDRIPLRRLRGHRPLVRWSWSCRRGRGSTTSSRSGAATTSSASTTRSTPRSPTARSAARRCASRTGTNARVDVPRSGRPAGRADRAGGAQPRAAPRLPGDGVPARPVPAHGELPAAGRARRRRLPAVRRGEDGARQPDPPPRRRRDRRRVRQPGRPARRVRELDGVLPVRHPRAGAPARGRAAADRQPGGALPARLQLRRRRLAVAPPTAHPTSTATWC